MDNKEDKNPTPLVSIIIPVYNVEKYLKECLDSVLNQSYANLEIICVDDGSTDSSPQILDEYAGKDERIQVISKENGGLSSARNTGLSATKGEYIYYLDSDDLITKNAIEVCVEVSEREQLDLLLFDGTAFYENEELEKIKSSYKNYYIRKNKYEGVLSGSELFSYMFKRDDYKTSACIQFSKKTFLINNDIKFIEGIVFEDNVYTLRLMLLSERAMHMAEQLFSRRVREDSIMMSGINAKEVYSLYFVLKHLILDFPKYNLKPEISSIVREYIIGRQSFSVRKIGSATEEQRQNAKKMMNEEDNLLFNLLVESLMTERIEKEKTIDELSRIKNSRSYKMTATALKPFRKT